MGIDVTSIMLGIFQFLKYYQPFLPIWYTTISYSHCSSHQNNYRQINSNTRQFRCDNFNNTLKCPATYVATLGYICECGNKEGDLCQGWKKAVHIKGCITHSWECQLLQDVQQGSEGSAAVKPIQQQPQGEGM